MKIIFIVLLITISLNLKAQQYYNKAVVDGNLNKYIVHKSDKSVMIFNSKNKFTKIVSKSTLSYYDPDMVGTKIDEKKLQDIFKQEINPVIWHLLTLDSENFVALMIDFDTNGKVVDVIFITNPTSAISPIVFEKIEDRIKKEITATYNQFIIKSIGAPAYTTFNYINYIREIYFSQL